MAKTYADPNVYAERTTPSEEDRFLLANSETDETEFGKAGSIIEKFTINKDSSLAISVLKFHNPILRFKGFVKPGIAAPQSPQKYDAYIVQDSGVVFTKEVLSGQLIYYTGNSYVVENIDLTIKTRSGTSQLFSKQEFNNDKIILSDGSLGDSSGSKTTDKIEVDSSKTTISYAGATSENKRYAFYDENEALLSAVVTASSSLTIAIPASAKFFALTFQAAADQTDYSETLMVNFGDPKPYENYQAILKSIRGTQIPEENSIQYGPGGSQLFSKQEFNNDKIILSDGSLGDSSGSKTTNKIEVDSSKTTISYAGATSENKRYAFYDENEALLSAVVTASSSLTIAIPASAKFFALTFQAAADLEDLSQTLMVNFGAPKPYEEYIKAIISINGYPFSKAASQIAAEAVSQISWQYNNTDASVTGTELYKMFTLLPNVDGDGDTIGCTGACYNTKIEQYVISYYSYAKASKLWYYKRKDLVDYSATGTITPTPTRELDISSYLYHIQGIAYDPSLDSYWILGSLNEVSDDNERVLIRIDDDGNLFEKIVLPYTFQAGMIAMSPDYNNLLIKANGSDWLLELDKETKTQIRQVTVASTTEGMGVDHAGGSVWIGSDSGNLYKYDYDTLTIIDSYAFETLPNGTSQNVEGIIIDPIDKAVIFVADAYLHGANNNGNAMWVFDFNKSINKQVRFPDMMKFQGNKSVVIDFGDVNDLRQALIEQGTGAVMYRGSNVAPTAPLINRKNWRDRPYYSDWGDTIPSEWSLSLPSYRYMQLMIV